ncbi:hypothetical protein [Haloarchaeobius iranensis]|uniref:Lipoprotein n=1 Tax=Haloarchaeobius iranensis TaxID=996166 RepID=A0A1G9ZHM3_9EURY|nr:hypothetical protein [Haloarchaeobius iranensis]SDN20066.1 hypothetical protein SAMN05192554_12024 [Haloarchaeobius iranensis]
MRRVPWSRLLVACLLVTAGCFTPDRERPREPSDYRVAANSDVDVPANATVVPPDVTNSYGNGTAENVAIVRFNETALAENETVRRTIEGTSRHDTNTTWIPAASYRTLWDVFERLPHRTWNSSAMTEPKIVVYVRYGGEVVRLELEPMVAG